LGKHIAGPKRIKTVLRRVACEKLDTKHRAFHPFLAQMPLELASTLIKSKKVAASKAKGSKKTRT